MVVGVLSLLAIPAGVFAARQSEAITLVNSAGTVALAAALGVYALLLAGRARERVTFTLGRARGEGAARVGRLLGLLGICAGLTGALAYGFYGLLSLLAE